MSDQSDSKWGHGKSNSNAHLNGAKRWEKSPAKHMDWPTALLARVCPASMYRVVISEKRARGCFTSVGTFFPELSAPFVSPSSAADRTSACRRCLSAWRWSKRASIRWWNRSMANATCFCQRCRPRLWTLLSSQLQDQRRSASINESDQPSTQQLTML